MSTEAQLANALRRLKVFPLPQGVLLPGSAVPLHVFEPRYRALVAAALESDRVLAIARLAPGWEADYEGRPPLLPVAGVGYIEEAELTEDGRYLILVRGVARVRIRAEHAPARPYREVQAEAVSEQPGQDPETVDTVRRTVLALSRTRVLPGELAQLLTIAAARVQDAGTLCDVVAAAVLEDPDALQGVLEAFDLKLRAERVLGGLGALLAEGEPPGGGLWQ